MYKVQGLRLFIDEARPAGHPVSLLNLVQILKKLTWFPVVAQGSTWKNTGQVVKVERSSIARVLQVTLAGGQQTNVDVRNILRLPDAFFFGNIQ